MVAVGINDPTLGLFSAANTSKSALLNTTFYSGVSEIVTGTRPLTDLNTLVREWRETGGSQMKTEFEAAIAAK
jgi:putative aldouronate transport system substrate-binding protein